MHRIIFELGGISITSWGLMLVIAFIVGIWVAERRALRYDIPKSIIPDLSIWLIIGGIVGGRLAFVIENWEDYAKYPGEIFKVWEGGLIFYGGVGLAVLFGIIFLKKKQISVPKVMDVVAPSIGLGLGIARIGCFLNGCCFGKPTNLPWGVVFPANSPPSWTFTGATHTHPTQLYESIAGFCMFLILLKIENRFKKKMPPGQLFGIFLAIYGGWRFFIDFLRYYDSQAYILGGLTHSQIVSLILLIGASGVILIRSKSNGFFKRHN